MTPPHSRSQSEIHSSDRIEQCESVIGHRFKNQQLLRSALTHASGADHRLASNERLEFLGDAILGMVVCELLFQQFPDYLEGELTRIKSVVVSRTTCTNISKQLGIQPFLIIGKGLTGNATVPASVLANVLEALIAAIYLDSGMEAARAFIVRNLEKEILQVAHESINGNFKSHLQQLSQKHFNLTPTYQLVEEKGPDHNKCFKIAAMIGLKSYPAAWGRNKKEAEQQAALNALNQLTENRKTVSTD